MLDTQFVDGLSGSTSNDFTCKSPYKMRLKTTIPKNRFKFIKHKSKKARKREKDCERHSQSRKTKIITINSTFTRVVVQRYSLVRGENKHPNIITMRLFDYMNVSYPLTRRRYFSMDGFNIHSFILSVFRHGRRILEDER